MGMSYKLVLLGPPGAGKGTQAVLLSKEFFIPSISTGDILREEVRNNTSLGEDAQQFMNKGLLVPDSLVIEIVKKRLLNQDCNDGYILDGFPRTVAQAESLIINKIEVDHVIFFDVSDDILIQRLSGRRSCPACHKMYHIHFDPPQSADVCDECHSKLIIRQDDEEHTIAKRISIYRLQTEPLIDFYASADNVFFHRIEGQIHPNETPVQILQRVFAELGYSNKK
jgi:adenylate kinase